MYLIAQSLAWHYHRTIGGYSPAKLRRYQDVIEYGLTNDFRLLNKNGLYENNFINMLNTKYLKQSTEGKWHYTKSKCIRANAWFVNAIKKKKKPEDEILKVREINGTHWSS